jgi:hypothetical protein
MNPLDLLAALKLEDDRRWGDAAEPWQWEMARTMLDPLAPPYRWESRPRSGSKTTDAGAVLLVMLLAQLPAGSRTYVFAVDKDQAKLTTDALGGLVRRTPELTAHIDLANYRVTVSSGSSLEVLPSDAGSSWGLKPSACVADEVCQWPSTTNAKQLWESVFSSMGKVPGAKLLAISNSGSPEHWTRKIYDAALLSPMWTVADVPGPLPWVSAEFLAEQRLHLNRWISAEGLLTTREDLAACARLPGPLLPQPGVSYRIGVDLGVKRDRSVASVCHGVRDGAGIRVVMDEQKVWTPRRLRPVDLTQVEEWLLDAAKRFNGARIIGDPWQFVAMAGRLRHGGCSVTEYPFTQTSISRLAQTLHVAIRDHRIDLPANDPELLDELASVQLRETSPNVLRLDHSASGHDDRAISLALAAHELIETGLGSQGWVEAWQAETAARDADPAAAVKREHPELAALPQLDSEFDMPVAGPKCRGGGSHRYQRAGDRWQCCNCAGWRE